MEVGLCPSSVLKDSGLDKYWRPQHEAMRMTHRQEDLALLPVRNAQG